MKKTLVTLCALLFFAGCSSSQFALYRPKNSEKQWNINANKGAIGGAFTVIINDSVVISEAPGIIARSFESKGNYQGHEVKLMSVYNDGFLGIGSGWETTILIDNEMAAKFKL